MRSIRYPCHPEGRVFCGPKDLWIRRQHRRRWRVHRSFGAKSAPQDGREIQGAGYLCLPEPLRVVSLERLSFPELSFDELSLDELSLDELSFEPLSDFGLSSFLSFEEESLDVSRAEESALPEDPGEEDFLA